MKAVAAFAALPVLLLAAAPAMAGDYDQYGAYGSGYGQSYGQGSYGYRSQNYGGSSSYHGGQSEDYGRYGQGGYYGQRYDYSYGGQQDVPGDYRCDAYWDRGRTDCNASWRDQRSYGSGYGYGRSGYGHDRGHSYYSSQSGRGYGRGTTYYGAYGQPDVVYAVPTGGYGGYGGSHGGGYGHGGGAYGDRNQGRIEWCRSAYRSYDSRSGYYRAYSGRLVYCG